MTLALKEDLESPSEIGVEDLSTSVIVIADHAITDANLAAQNALQLGLKGLIAEYQSGNHSVLKHLKQVLENAEQQPVNVIYDRFSFGQDAFDYTLSLLDDGRAVCEFSKARDTHTAENSTSLEWIAHMLGHELRTPLSGIKGIAQLLGLKLEGAENADLLTMLHHETERIENLSRSLDVFCGAQPMDMNPLNIHEILDAAAVHIPEGITVKRFYDPSLPSLMGEKALLQMMFLNLIKNAGEALDGSQDPEICLVTGYDADYRRDGVRYPYRIEITDNGAGIPDELQARIFQPFFTTRAKGQGIGLALVRQIVEAHQGIVRVFSKPGETKFVINFKKDI